MADAGILNAAIEKVIDKFIRAARTVVPGKVSAVTRTLKGEVDVNFDAGIGVRKNGKEAADGDAPNAPVLFPGGGGFSMRWPLHPQDEVVALCSDRNIERWRQTKLVGQAHSFSERHHDLSDALVLPVRMTPPTPTPPATVTNETTDWVLQGPLGDVMRVSPTGPVTLRKGGIEGVTVATLEFDAAGSITVSVPSGQTVKLGGPAATLGVARQTDKTAADTAMAVWIGQVQAVTTAAAALLGMAPPTPPTDFGVIMGGSIKVLSE